MDLAPSKASLNCKMPSLPGLLGPQPVCRHAAAPSRSCPGQPGSRGRSAAFELRPLRP